MTLQDYLEKGVTQISVRDGEATAVNPYKQHGQHDPDYSQWQDFIKTLSPIPCPAIPDGVYGVEQLRNRYEIFDVASQEWQETTLSNSQAVEDWVLQRTVLVLKDQPEEKPEGESENWLCGEDYRFIDELPVQPEGEEAFLISLVAKWKAHRKKLSENMDLYKKLGNSIEYDKTFSNWNTVGLMIWDLEDSLCRKGIEVDTLPPVEPEGETIERSAEEGLTNAIGYLTQSQEWKKWPERTEPHICYYVAPDRIAKLMQEHAQNRLNQYQSGLIEKLEADIAEGHTDFYNHGIREAINLIKNS